MSRSRSKSPSKTDLLINSMTQLSFDEDPSLADFSFLPNAVSHRMRQQRLSVDLNGVKLSPNPTATTPTPTTPTTPASAPDHSLGSQSPYKIDLALPTENDFSSSLYSTLQLDRKNTITSSTMGALSRKPSESGHVFQQLKYARSKHQSNSTNGSPVTNPFQNMKSWRSDNSGKGYISRFDDINPNSDSPKEIDEATFNSTHETRQVVESKSQDPKPQESEPEFEAPNPPISHYPFDDSVDFDTHINEPITSIPTPYLNAISFTPPVQQQGRFDDVSSLGSSSSVNQYYAETINSSVCSPVVDESTSPSREATPTPPSTIASALKPEPFKPDVDPQDRGRLFLKIAALRDVRLPLPALSATKPDPHPRFTLTIDNGIQCVTTNEIPLDMDAKIDQEFELVVGEDLELLLTLKAYMDPPILEQQQQARQTTNKPAAADSNGSRSRSTSPKKKGFKLFGSSSPSSSSSSSSSSSLATAEFQRRQEAEALERARLIRQKADIWHNILGPQAEFARAYIMESQYEREIYGKPQSFLLSCFNEWGQVEKEIVRPNSSAASRPTATGKPAKNASNDKNNNNSNLTKRYVTEKRPPYRIGGLQITMMYVPKSNKREILPISMAACVDVLAMAQARRDLKFSGYMSQEGDDCSYWRRRWFDLRAGQLAACHEESRKIRKVYDLAKASKIELLSNVVDSGQLEDDQYIFVDGAFRIYFRAESNAEVGTEAYYDRFINFYADDKESRDKWVQLLRMAMQYTPGEINNWTDLVLDKQKQELIKSQKVKGAWDSWGKKSGFIECV